MWAYYPETKDAYAAFSKSREAVMGELVFSEKQAPSGLQGLVMAEALNVLESTQLTPLQLQARVAELEAALRKAVDLAAEDDNVRAESELWNHLLKVSPK